MWGAGAAVFMVLCCALPVLIAGGALAGVGGLLRSPWLIGVGALVVAVALITVTRHRRSGDNCCPPTNTDMPEDPFHKKGPYDR